MSVKPTERGGSSLSGFGGLLEQMEVEVQEIDVESIAGLDRGRGEKAARDKLRGEGLMFAVSERVLLEVCMDR